MEKTVVDNSSMQCSLGTKPTNIKVTSQAHSKIEGSLIATEQDKEGIINIPTFGNCKCVWYQPTCVPKPIDWQNISNTNKINGLGKLTKNSQCQCSKGGLITFIDSGSNTFDDVE